MSTSSLTFNSFFCLTLYFLFLHTFPENTILVKNSISFSADIVFVESISNFKFSLSSTHVFHFNYSLFNSLTLFVSLLPVSLKLLSPPSQLHIKVYKKGLIG
ncbi:hypothetical protein P8452_22181 [Trifolium repens]|nr:hypothetical protein P8452_22181 [Trifolium repens]